MKKLAFWIALILVVSFFPVQSLEAHPGRTDANGGHTCRTNCEKWGLKYGEYHYHNKGSQSSGSTTKAASPKPPAVKKEQPKPVVVPKIIVAVDQANIFSAPFADSAVTGTLWYGFELVESGNHPEFISIQQGYVSKKVITTYTAITPKTVQIQAEKGYFFSTPSAQSTGRGSAAKGALVQVVGENGDWYYGSTQDAQGKVLVGFVSKSVAY
ncbi:YHYH domain-containing protein [Brevibacillus parabrevis]|uniref:YHYH domain-containing protein n=1 Tax=Brevibacillus parabrevis TaxID=54914 RepID=UPI0028D6C52A|nr:YHYH domain-containing protein [Brevibacillus parabrevis]